MMGVDRTLRWPLGVMCGGVGVGVLVRGVWNGLGRLCCCNLITICIGQRDVAPELDLTNSISDS